MIAVNTNTGMEKSVDTNLLERRHNTWWAKIESMVVGERQGVEAHLLQGIQDKGVGIPEI